MLRKSRKRTAEKAPNSVENESAERHKLTRKSFPILGDKSAKDKAEGVLESLVLGGDDDIVEKLGVKPKTSQKTTVDHAEFDSDEEYEKKKSKNDDKERKPVWEDEDDDHISVKVDVKEKRFEAVRLKGDKVLEGNTYRNRLQKQFQKVSGTPSWALPQSKDHSSSEDEDNATENLVTSTGNYLTSSVSLPKGILDFKRCTDANRDHPGVGKLRSVQFHPSAQVVMTAGMNQTLTLFQVDGKHNPKIQSIFVENFPIHTARFSADGKEVLLGSRHRHFYFYDMIAGKVVNVPAIKGLDDSNMGRFEVSPDGKYIVFLGKYGFMHILSAKAKEHLTSLKMNGEVGGIVFSKDGSTLYSHGDDGEVYVWDMKKRTCIHRFVDDGCIKGTCIDVSHNGQYLATGSNSGVVNIYDLQKCLSSRRPTPIKSIMNLVTPCSQVKFNPTTEILAIASNDMEGAMRMVHIPSMTAFSNFPDRTDGMRIPYSMDFSLHGGYLVVGNSKGRALLYRLKHYGSY
ncbi:U3 small nucleolar RNA-associated protein 18 homolog [Lineus longissimus]|uniref:U3 small nucleolar RNA-associated protein 18 homolog n=1 Tax=Lineus longissimus TaxID=88925 RepID=UPI002B4CE5C3